MFCVRRVQRRQNTYLPARLQVVWRIECIRVLQISVNQDDDQESLTSTNSQISDH